MWTLIAFAVGTVPILFLSRRSLFAPRAHGFPRFFAFECLLLLIVLNAGQWFRDPTSPRQLASWLCLAGSALLAGHSFHVLRVAGRPSGREDPSPNLAFENTTSVVTVGAYRYIRHPMYASLGLLGVGAFLKSVTAGTTLLLLGTVLLLGLTARLEERENVTRFAQTYQAYMARTRRFIPGVW
jgi:protein-S-isoprenylcysteine O-methyltransferase Ste14